ncbi:MAG TPA: FtsX-like permease family protein [Thermoanaerobaculia bacterium]|nr:FtsX-like permease family protein [Thermoanaerobaculia bacterium]
MVDRALVEAAWPEALAESRARGAVTRSQPPVTEIATLAEVTRDPLRPSRFASTMLGLFGALALLLAVLGLASVLAYSVAQRRSEVTVRIALGATRRSIARQFLLWSAVATSAGMIVGAAAALGAGRLLAGLLHGFQPHDAVSRSAASALLVAVGLIAGAVPARPGPCSAVACSGVRMGPCRPAKSSASPSSGCSPPRISCARRPDGASCSNTGSTSSSRAIGRPPTACGAISRWRAALSLKLGPASSPSAEPPRRPAGDLVVLTSDGVVEARDHDDLTIVVLGTASQAPVPPAKAPARRRTARSGKGRVARASG